MVGPLSSYYTWSWAAIVLVWTLAALGLASAVWALFADRARGRRRCSKCWYDMGGAPGLVCPECGRAVKTERGLRRTKRRYWWALFALLVALAPVTPPAWRFVREEKYWPWAPKSFLIRALPWACTRRGYWREFESRVVEQKYERGGWDTSVTYSPRSLTRGQLDLLVARIVEALSSTAPDVPRAELLGIASQLDAASPKLDAAAIGALSDPDWAVRRPAMAIVNERRLPPGSVLPAIVSMVSDPVPDGMLWGDQEKCLAEAASFLGRAASSDPRAIRALIDLYKMPYEPKMGYVLRGAVLRAFAEIGPAASEAAELLRVPDEYEPWLGSDRMQLFAYWMVSSRYGDRCATLVQMAGLSNWNYRDFAMEELGRGAACPQAIALLERSMRDEMHWVRIEAAMSLIRLGHPSSEAYAVLKADAADNFDAFWRITRFAIERGLDPAPLEAMIPAYRQPSSRVPDVTVDNVERELREYREHRPASEPFEPW